MLTKVVEQRGMNWQTGSEEQGEVIQGTMTKQADYNYPLTTVNESGRTNGSSLDDAPTYTSQKEKWAGRDVEEDAITTYAFNNNTTKFDGYSNSPAREVIVTQPMGAISKQYSYRTPNAWTDGLVFTDESYVVEGSTEVLVGKSMVSWDQGNSTGNLNYGAPRPAYARSLTRRVTSLRPNIRMERTSSTRSRDLATTITQMCCFDVAPQKYENSTAYIGDFNSSGQYTLGRHISIS